MCNEIKLITGANAQFQIEVFNDDDTAHSLAGYDAIEMEIRKKPNSPVVWRATLEEGLSKSSNVITADFILEEDVKEGVYYADADLLISGVVKHTTEKIKVIITQGITQQQLAP